MYHEQVFDGSEAPDAVLVYLKGQTLAHATAADFLHVISLGIDQDAQEHFFHPERQDVRRKGAGGVPVRSADDYR